MTTHLSHNWSTDCQWPSLSRHGSAVLKATIPYFPIQVFLFLRVKREKHRSVGLTKQQKCKKKTIKQCFYINSMKVLEPDAGYQSGITCILLWNYDRKDSREWIK